MKDRSHEYDMYWLDRMAPFLEQSPIYEESNGYTYPRGATQTEMEDFMRKYMGSPNETDEYYGKPTTPNGTDEYIGIEPTTSTQQETDVGIGPSTEKSKKPLTRNQNMRARRRLKNKAKSLQLATPTLDTTTKGDGYHWYYIMGWFEHFMERVKMLISRAMEWNKAQETSD